MSPTASARHTPPYQRPTKHHGPTVTIMTNTRMENGGNLSQSMDSVNNVAVVGEEEVRTNHFDFPPRVDLIKVGCMVQSIGPKF